MRATTFSLLLLQKVDYEIWDPVDHQMDNVCDIGIERELFSAPRFARIHYSRGANYAAKFDVPPSPRFQDFPD